METYSTLRPTNFVLKPMALNCICKKDNRIVASWSLFKNLSILFILCPINALALYFKVIHTDITENGFTFTDAVHYEFIFGFIKYIVDLAYVKMNSSKECIDYYYAYENIDNILKIRCYDEMKKNCRTIVTLICAGCIFTFIFEFTAWHLVQPIDTEDISFVIQYFYSFAQVLTVLDMISHLVQIENRLRTFGDIAEKLIGTNMDMAKRTNVFKVTEPFSWTPDDIISLSRCYLMLINQTEFINNLFGFRVSLLIFYFEFSYFFYSYLFSIVKALKNCSRVD